MRHLLDWSLAGGYTYVVVLVQPQWWQAYLDELNIVASRGRLFCTFELRDWNGHTLVRSGSSGTDTLPYYATSYGARQAAERYLIRAGLMTKTGERTASPAPEYRTLMREREGHS